MAEPNVQRDRLLVGELPLWLLDDQITLDHQLAVRRVVDKWLPEYEALSDIALAAANFRDSFSGQIGESYVAAASLDAAFARLEEVRRDPSL